MFGPERFNPIGEADEKSGRVPPLDPRDNFFGYGRCICQGLHLAQATAWAAIAGILASFELHLKDPRADFKAEFTDGGLLK